MFERLDRFIHSLGLIPLFLLGGAILSLSFFFVFSPFGQKKQSTTTDVVAPQQTRTASPSASLQTEWRSYESTTAGIMLEVPSNNTRLIEENQSLRIFYPFLVTEREKEDEYFQLDFLLLTQNERPFVWNPDEQVAEFKESAEDPDATVSQSETVIGDGYKAYVIESESIKGLLRSYFVPRDKDTYLVIQRYIVGTKGGAVDRDADRVLSSLRFIP